MSKKYVIMEVIKDEGYPRDIMDHIRCSTTDKSGEFIWLHPDRLIDRDRVVIEERMDGTVHYIVKPAPAPECDHVWIWVDYGGYQICEHCGMLKPAQGPCTCDDNDAWICGNKEVSITKREACECPCHKPVPEQPDEWEEWVNDWNNIDHKTESFVDWIRRMPIRPCPKCGKGGKDNG